jgi:hypothetical protein
MPQSFDFRLYFGLCIIELRNFCSERSLVRIEGSHFVRFRIGILGGGASERSRGQDIVIVSLFQSLLSLSLMVMVLLPEDVQLSSEPVDFLSLSLDDLVFGLGQLLHLIEDFDECYIGGVHVKEISPNLLEGRFDVGGRRGSGRHVGLMFDAVRFFVVGGCGRRIELFRFYFIVSIVIVPGPFRVVARRCAVCAAMIPLSSLLVCDWKSPQDKACASRPCLWFDSCAGERKEKCIQNRG